MKLRELDKRDVLVYAWTGMDEDVYTWGACTAIRAAVYPGSETIRRMPYGESAKQTAVLLYDGDMTLETGMGVSLDGGTPSYRIAQVERWAHTRAVLECIPGREKSRGSSI